MANRRKNFIAELKGIAERLKQIKYAFDLRLDSGSYDKTPVTTDLFDARRCEAEGRRLTAAVHRARARRLARILAGESGEEGSAAASVGGSPHFA